jgi:hypothetical protein
MNISAKDKVIDQQFMAALEAAQGLAADYLNEVAVWQDGKFLLARLLPVGGFDAQAYMAGWVLRAKLTRYEKRFRVQIFG